eukprot:GEMP01039893.1.p1 GENE.GEMP01039893.1~~GEMP01039893.1.p1  ORF type:complete len:154 (+),score=22.64 GEMP01039893.1:385-846(+)
MKVVNDICDFFFSLLQSGVHKNSHNLQLFICFFNVVLSAWPLCCYLIYSTDIHVIFWLGETPQYVNLAVPICLVCLNLGVNFFQCFSTRAKSARIGCCSMFLLLGLTLFMLGGYVAMEAEVKAKELRGEECGKHGGHRTGTRVASFGRLSPSL